jgi:iron complex outermembrane receptor protein
LDQSRSLERDHSAALRLDKPSAQHALAISLEESGHQRDASVSNGAMGVTEEGVSWDQNWVAWLQDEWSLNASTTVTTGLRAETIAYAVEAMEQRHTRWLPLLAVRWEPMHGWVGRTSLGAGLKPPQLAELTNQPVFSVNSNTPLEPDRRGNPNLQPERSVNLEAALERYLPGEAGVIGANLYLRHTTDFTERRIQMEGTRWVDRPYNEGFARHWGLELDAKLRTDQLGWRGATLRAHLTVPRSAVDDSRLGMTRDARETPRYTLSAGFDQTRAEMSYGMSMQYNDGPRTEVPREQVYVTESRAVLDAYVLQKLNARLNLRVSLQNLLAAETRRQMAAYSGANSWSLASVDQGARSLLVSLEGKW